MVGTVAVTAAVEVATAGVVVGAAVAVVVVVGALVVCAVVRVVHGALYGQSQSWFDGLKLRPPGQACGYMISPVVTSHLKNLVQSVGSETYSTPLIWQKSPERTGLGVVVVVVDGTVVVEEAAAVAVDILIVVVDGRVVVVVGFVVVLVEQTTLYDQSQS